MLFSRNEAVAPNKDRSLHLLFFSLGVSRVQMIEFMGVNSINGKKQELRLCGMLFRDSLAESMSRINCGKSERLLLTCIEMGQVSIYVDQLH